MVLWSLLHFGHMLKGNPDDVSLLDLKPDIIRGHMRSSASFAVAEIEVVTATTSAAEPLYNEVGVALHIASPRTSTLSSVGAVPSTALRLFASFSSTPLFTQSIR